MPWKARHVAFRDRAAFRATVKERAAVHNAEIVALGGQPLDVDDVVEQFDQFGQRLTPYVTDTVELLHAALDRGCADERGGA